MQINIGETLTRRTRRMPNREALVETDSGRRFTYSDINARTNRLANGLRDMGVIAGDRVGILLMNCSEFVETFFAVAKLGATLVPLNWRLTSDELEFILKDSGSTTLVFGPEFSDQVAEIKSRGYKTDLTRYVQLGGVQLDFSTDFTALTANNPETEPEIKGGNDDLLFIMYTSGTTGLPKGVMHSHNTVFAAITNMMATNETGIDETTLLSLPLFHVGALTPAFQSIYSAARLVITRSFDPLKSWEIIQQEKATNTLLVPAMLQAMKAVFDPAKHDPSSMRSMVSGAAPVPVSMIEDFAKMGISINQVYGMTETCGPGCLILGEDAAARPGSTGKGYFYTDIRITDPEGNECPPGVSGEVCMRAPNNMVGYWNRPEATAETLIDGWLHSGDVGVADADGFVTIVERLKDMLISGGENVYPAEIENVLHTHAGVADVAVIGIPSAKWGESAMAVVVKTPGSDVTEDELIALTKAKLAGFKCIRAVRFTDIIPRNASGKILKRALRERYADVHAPE
ncbi:long-chain-fatty-acid--CoA ligase FadD13 [Litorimonas cladophorae]|uniref:3-methylmercaptopropionyl-CoA ligase n=1 Tax=Litorimonas cladophorae TaxID=1220491 RepID=A0A918NHX8_9PROT|nr:long-chain-fatty-acid--CoA ligase [Litorimonas cladophorae]GGX68790.1 long-chain-fatty-acid--CoA ligase FadD13 [Litorimonas cladophorae]